MPATVQAAIAARIDRLSAPAKQTLNAASVIGVRFGAELLAALGIDPVFDELLSVELIDQVRFTPSAEYTFRHPLIRAVAYESQLKSDRAKWHRRLAAAIQERAPGVGRRERGADRRTSGGRRRSARRIRLAHARRRVVNQPRYRRRPGQLGACVSDRRQTARRPDPDQLSMRIAPRTMLCATDFQSRAVQDSRGRFAELRELCNAAGDKVSLAIGMTGLATELLYAGRPSEGSQLASEQMALLESIGDPTLTVGLAFIGFANWFNSGEFDEIMRWSQTVIDLADGDPTKGADFGIGSPLAIAETFRGVARFWLGRPGWRHDLHAAVTMAQSSDPITHALVVAWTYGVGIWCGVLRADDSALRTIEKAVHAAQMGSNDFALNGAKFTLAAALLHRESAADRHRGLELMVQARDNWLPVQAPSLVPVAELWASREAARRGDSDAAVPLMRKAADVLHQEGRLGWEVCSAGILVETLLERGAEGDLAEAQEAIDRLANLGSDEGWAIRDIMVLQLRALIARAHGSDTAFRDSANRYHEMAESLGFEGHIARAKGMIEGVTP